MNDNIEELINLEDIEECENIYLNKKGYLPFNISTWNPSDDYSNNFILNKVKLTDFSYINYIYSYELDNELINQASKKLSSKNGDNCLFTNSGTSSINLVAACLKNMDVKKIMILNPSYYTIFYNCIQNNIRYIELSLIRNDNGYRLPIKEIEKYIENVDAVWITNPVYSTGVYYSDEDINYLQNNILNRKLLIADECFCISGNELLRNFDSNNNFIGIYDPMKQVLINGIKFSAVIFPDAYKNLFIRWSDIICGSLSYSALQAIDFFNKKEFDSFSRDLHKKNLDLYKYVMNLSIINDNILFDRNVSGHMLMGYCNKIHYNHLQGKKAVLNFMNETGACVIPGNRFHFNKNFGFTFRINLARDCAEFRTALTNVFLYLKNI